MPQSKTLLIEDDRAEMLQLESLISKFDPDMIIEKLRDVSDVDAYMYLVENQCISPPKYIFLDLCLSSKEVEGLHILEQMKKSTGMQDSKIMILTGNENPDVIAKSCMLNADHFEVKPISEEKLAIFYSGDSDQAFMFSVQGSEFNDDDK